MPLIRVWIHEFPPVNFIAGGEVMADRLAEAEPLTSP